MVNKVYLENFESRIMDELLRLCTQYKVLEGTLLATDDIDARWHELAPEYVADAVPNIADYPTVAIAWAGYLGMGVAHLWDEDWAAHCKDEYKSFYGELETLKALGLIAAFSMLDTKMENIQGAQNNLYTQNVLADTYAEVNKLGAKIIDRALDIQPTITIPQGTEVKIITNVTMSLPPVDFNPQVEKYVRK